MFPIFTDNHDCAPANEATLAAFEQANGIKLPDDYRHFLLSSPGGSPERYMCDWGTNGDFVMWVYGLHDGEDWKRLPKAVSDFDDICVTADLNNAGPRYLPVAVSNGGNYFLLHVMLPDFGAVSFFDHECTGREEPPLRIANSFTEWLSGLKDFDKGD